MPGIVLGVEATAVNQIHRESCPRGADVLVCVGGLGWGDIDRQ